MNESPEIEQWLDRVRAALDDGTFVKITLGGPCGTDSSLRQVLVRRVALGEGERLTFVHRQDRQDVTKHLPIPQGIGRLRGLAGGDFRHAHLFTTRRVVELQRREGKRPRLVESKPVHAVPPSTKHDREKKRSLEPRDSPWLHGLGVTTAEGKVRLGMEAKFRQIGRFVELLQHQLEPLKSPAAPANFPFTLVDMGCGKGYLTFAACDWLRRAGWPGLVVRGIEARVELVDLGNRVARDSGFDQLRFESGSIADTELDRADVLVALHACDTATDDAIAKGVRAGAGLILVAPCCHQELRPQLKPPPVLAGALRHGILLERQAEFVTDALRAALLEWAGYDTRVFEFISTEHTGKNLMIAATKRARGGDREELASCVRELAGSYGIQAQQLATRLGFDLAPTTHA